jgi:excisionase family DNA binding protein
MSAAEQTAQEWFTTAEACVYLRVNRRTLLRAIAAGELVPDSRARPGLRCHRFRRATLDAYLEGGR